MRKMAWLCVVLLICAMVMGMRHIEMVPANANVVLQVGHLDTRLWSMLDLDVAEMEDMMSVLGFSAIAPIDQWEFLLFGRFGIHPFILEVLDDLAYLEYDPKPLISLLQQPIGVIGNMVPPLVIHLALQEIGKQLVEDEAFFDVQMITIDDVTVIHYQVDQWFESKPWTLNLYLALLDDQFLLVTDRDLLMDALAARKDPAYRLIAVNEGFGKAMQDEGKHMLTFYNSLFPLSNLLFGMVQMNHGKALSEWVTMDMDDGLTMRWTSEMAYSLPVDRKRALGVNIPLEALEKIRSFPEEQMPTASMMLALTPTQADLTMIAKMVDALFYPYIDGRLLEEGLVLSQAFAQMMDYSWLWLDSPENVLMYWVDAHRPLEMMDIISLLTGEPVQSNENLVWVDGYSVYSTVISDEQIVEIGTGIHEMTGENPFYPHLEPVPIAFPQEWARIASREEGALLWAFIPNQLSLSGGFLADGHFELNLHLDSHWLTGVLALGQARNALTSIVETYWYLYDVWDDMIWYEIPMDPDAFDRALEDYAYHYYNAPGDLNRFYWEYHPDQAGARAELKVTYVGELLEGLSADRILDQLYEGRWPIPDDVSFEVVEDSVMMKMETSGQNDQSWIEPMQPIVLTWWNAVDEMDRLFWWNDDVDVTGAMVEEAFAESYNLDEEIWSWFSWDFYVRDAQYEVVLCYMGPIPQDAPNDLLRQALEDYTWYKPDHVTMFEEDGYLKMVLVYDRPE